MKVCIIFSIFLVSSQGFFLKHFEDKFNTIAGWFSPITLNDTQTARLDEEEILGAGVVEHEVLVEPEVVFKLSRRRSDAEIPEEETNPEEPYRRPRCKTVEKKVV